MNMDVYTVKTGDTLTRIAHHYGTTPQALARINHLTNIDVIRVGQKLQVSGKTTADTHHNNQATTEAEASSLWVQLMDALSEPIAGLKVWIHVDGETHEHVSGSDGFLPAIAIERAEVPVRIEVAKATGGRKQIAHWVSTPGNTHLMLNSPKVAIHSSMRPHDGPPKPPAKPAPLPLGKVADTRSPAGHPVQQVVMECPNPQNLKLLTNFKYRDIVIAAAQRSGFTPQAVAAIMRAEAATMRTVVHLPVVDAKGKPVIDKKTGKPKTRRLVRDTGQWDPHSASPLSSARGMTQFLDASWIDQALTEGTYLNAYVKQQKWLTTSILHWTTTSKDKKGHAHTHKHERTVQAFVLANGTDTATATRARSLARVLSSRPYLTGRATASDANLQTLLDLRFKPEFAIQTAVDYGMQNLKALSKAGYAVDSLDDADKSKIIYLCHHLGQGDAKDFIQNTISSDHAEHLLVTQVGRARATIMVNQNKDEDKDNYAIAHRRWLSDFINKKIDVLKTSCDTTKIKPPQKLLDITNHLKM